LIVCCVTWAACCRAAPELLLVVPEPELLLVVPEPELLLVVPEPELLLVVPGCGGETRCCCGGSRGWRGGG
jgi:hypothetical protein